MNIIITCGIFLLDKNDKLLIGHPTSSDAIKHDFWSIPKGWNENGENYFESAKRELMEEANIDLDIIKSNILYIKELTINDYRGYNPFLKRVSDKKIASYIVKTNRDFSNDDIKCDSMVTHMGPPFPEIDEFKWVTIEEAMVILHKSQHNPLIEVKRILSDV